MIYSLCVWHHGAHGRRVGFVNTGYTAQLALVLGGLLGEDVALERLTALDAATGANDKTLLRSALGFHLRHDYSLSYGGRCFPVEKLDNPYTTFYRGLFAAYRSGHPLLPKRLNLISS
jgi:hypothetical protein